MKETELERWEDVLSSIDEIKKNLCIQHNRMFFRGQSNSTWRLNTTLERSVEKPLEFIEYYQIVLEAKSIIEAKTPYSWCISNESYFGDWLNSLHAFGTYTFSEMPTNCFEYFAYLRHYGFPSPLLDWTINPYIALFFAFNNDGIPESGYVSIYCYSEMPNNYKVRQYKKGSIYIFNQNEAGFKRHTSQESRYSFCLKLNENNNYNPMFLKHDLIPKHLEANQDIIWKFNIPYSERKKVWKILSTKNIDSYELFGSDDSLVQSIATKILISRF